MTTAAQVLQYVRLDVEAGYDIALSNAEARQLLALIDSKGDGNGNVRPDCVADSERTQSDDAS